jgi:hypothetical protein
MKRAVFTANYNDILCENVRQSFQHAADRWGAEYVEATEENHPVRLHPATVKLEPFMLTDADAVFIIDADAVISSRCPNPFAVMPEEQFSVVGLSKRIDPDGQLAWCGNVFEWGMVNALPGIEPVPSDGWSYFNSGMMLAWRTTCMPAMALAHEMCRIPNRCGWIEQTFINWTLKKLSVPMHYADERWNFIHPQTLGPNWRDMNAVGGWVYHGAGEPDRLHWLPETKWL